MLEAANLRVPIAPPPLRLRSRLEQHIQWIEQQAEKMACLLDEGNVPYGLRQAARDR
jgi:hypothetical protein